MPTRGKTEKHTYLLSRCRFPGDGYRASGEVLRLKVYLQPRFTSQRGPEIAQHPARMAHSRHQLRGLHPLHQLRHRLEVLVQEHLPGRRELPRFLSVSKKIRQGRPLRSACGGEVTVPGAYSRGFLEFCSRILYMYAS